MSYLAGPASLSLAVWQPPEAYSCHSCSSKPSPLNPTRVDFNIFFKYNLQFIDSLDDGSTHFLGSGSTTTLQTSCSFDLSSFLKHSETSHATLSEKLSSLGIEEDAVDNLVAEIFSHGQILFSKRESNKGKGDIFLNVEIKKQQLVWLPYERYSGHRVMRESMQELESRNYGMVPASESSLGLLKRVTVTAITNRESQQSKSCSICLEEIEVGSEATSLPCSHLFHGECIVKWLKQSHYCPICRYEMPTH